MGGEVGGRPARAERGRVGTEPVQQVAERGALSPDVCHAITLCPALPAPAFRRRVTAVSGGRAGASAGAGHVAGIIRLIGMIGSN
ncbi:hypothetical protein GCM10009530_49220 [Microbispora corallina]|uniref:Uncharacterized protein n=1 Tax=Microbispora corallina TaxID=83302 RepID=A0ABQ4FQS7_9ACTN|nr:hypothetical protein Mco01_01270 [Microbispora corallina]